LHGVIEVGGIQAWSEWPSGDSRAPADERNAARPGTLHCSVARAPHVSRHTHGINGGRGTW
jgi:hypothetical protein